MSKETYPELDAIPPAPPRPYTVSTGSKYVPEWFAWLSATFPLVVFPAAQLVAPRPAPQPTRPTLYVAPHLCRDGTFSPCSTGSVEYSDESSLTTRAFSSSDPVALRWQLEFLFRKVDFDVQFIDPTHNWGPAKSMPFLHLPSDFQTGSTFGKASFASRNGQALLPASALSHFLENYFPMTKVELSETSSDIWPDKATQLESRTWINLLEGRVMAAVLLVMILSPQSQTYLKQQQRQGLLSNILSTQLQTTFNDQQLRRVSTLNPAASIPTTKGTASSQPTTRLPSWEVGLLGWVGARTSAGTSAISSADGDAAGEGETAGATLVSSAVDLARAISDATVALQAFADRTKSSLSVENPKPNLLGATKPTSLDALAFAVIHTVMTLAATPQAQAAQDNETLHKLKAVLDASPWLVNWSRTIWKTYVKPLERA